MNSKDKEQPKKGIQTRGKGKTKAVCKPCAEGKSGGEKAYETDVPTDGVARTGDTVREYASDAASGGLAARPNTPIVSRAVRPNTLDLPHPNTQAIQTAPVAQRRSKLTEKSRASTLGASARSVCDREADVESVTSQSRTIKKRKQPDEAQTPRRGPDGYSTVNPNETESEMEPLNQVARRLEPVLAAEQAGQSRPASRMRRSADVTTDNESVRSHRSNASNISQRTTSSQREELADLRQELKRMSRRLVAREAEVRELTDIIVMEQARDVVVATSGDEVVVRPAAGVQNQAPRMAAMQPAVRQAASAGAASDRNGDNVPAQPQPSQRVLYTAAGAPGGDGGDGDDGDSDRDYYRRNRDQHLRDAVRRRAARLSDNPGAAHPPAQPGRSQPSLASLAHVPPPGPAQSGTSNAQAVSDAVMAASAALQALAPTRLHIEQINLPKFNGQDFNLFYKQFESIANDQGWNEVTRGRKLMESLEGDTRRHVESYMSYREMLEALGQYYAGSRPSIEAKNALRNFRKNREETLEAFASRIQAYADGSRLSHFDKIKYMQEAFMNGLFYDPRMQRYIEKRTSQDENVHIVKLLKAAQDYQHDKQGSAQNPVQTKRQNYNNMATGQPKNQRAAGTQAAPELVDMNSNNNNNGVAPQMNFLAPQANVLKTGRKEPLRHDDPAVQPEVEDEQEKVRQERAEKQQARAIGRKEFEELQQQLALIAQNQQQQMQRQNNRRNDNYQGYRNNQDGQYNNQGGQYNRGYNNRGGYQGNQGPPRGYNNGAPRPYNPNYGNNGGGNFGQNNAPQQQGNFRPQFPPNTAAPPPNDRNMPQDIRRNYGPPPVKYTPSAPLGQTPSQPAPATLNQHTTSNAPAATDDAFLGVDKSVYPENSIYSSSSSGSQA